MAIFGHDIGLPGSIRTPPDVLRYIPGMADTSSEHTGPPPRRIEIIARGLARRDGSVLLCRSVAGGHSYLPGGHVEPGESAADALAREFMEETGVETRVGPLLLAAEVRFTQDGRARHELDLVFHVEHARGDWPGAMPTLEPDIRFEWTPTDRLAEAGFVPACLRRFIQPAPTASRSTDGDTTEQPPIVWISANE